MTRSTPGGSRRRWTPLPTLPPDAALARLGEALDWWRGPAYAEFAYEEWAAAECSRLAELRLHAVERRAEARLALGLAAEAVPDLDAHVAEHPWREDAWRLLALALYRAGRQGDALALLRRARTLLVEQLGVDPGPGLRRLEADILDHADRLVPGSRVERVWAETAAVYDRTVATGARARLESTVGLLRSLAVTGGGGLEAARRQRTAAIAAAEELGDAELTARVIGAYDVPAIWPRSDDPTQAAEIVAAAERALALGPHDAARARLLATIAVESRGTGGARAAQAAAEAEAIARRLDDPAAARVRAQRRVHADVPPGRPRSGARRDRRRAHRAVRPARSRHLRGARAPDPAPGPQRARGLRRRRRARGGRRSPGRAARAPARRGVHRVVPGAALGGRRRRRRPRPPTGRPPRGSTVPACPACSTARCRSRCSACTCGAAVPRRPAGASTGARTSRGRARSSCWPSIA